MPQSSLFGGERSGARIFKFGRIGFDQGDADLGSNTYTGIFRSERVAPAGPGGLVNFRRVSIHLLCSGSYTMTVKVWVDGDRTVLGDSTTQTAVFSRTVGARNEITEEMEIEAEGSHIQVQIEIDSDDITGVFLIEGIAARGRTIRQGATRTGEAE